MFCRQHPGTYTTHQHVATRDQEQPYISRPGQGQVLGYARVLLSTRPRKLLAYSTAIYSWLFKTQAACSPLLLTPRSFFSPLLVLKMEEVWGCKVSSREVSSRLSSETQDWAPTCCHLAPPTTPHLDKPQHWRDQSVYQWELLLHPASRDAKQMMQVLTSTSSKR